MTSGVRSSVFTGVSRGDNYDGWSGMDRGRPKRRGEERGEKGKEGEKRLGSIEK